MEEEKQTVQVQPLTPAEEIAAGYKLGTGRKIEIDLRRAGHSALRWNKEKKKLQVYDPNP